MAYRRYKKKFYGSRAYRGYRKASFNKAGLNITPAFLAGLVVGYTNMDDKLPSEVVMGAAVAPVKGLGAFKAGAQGIVAGNMLQKATGGNVVSGGSARNW